jgi:Tol biopolymer transport system component/DNA-binding winged helix-turn-helix (wHTH) protein
VLVKKHGHIVEKDALINQVWAGSFVEEGNLKVTISMLRKALGQDGAAPQYIETVPRRGYRFVAEVRDTSGEDLLVYERTKSTLTIEEAGPAKLDGAAVAGTHLVIAQKTYSSLLTRNRSIILALALVAAGIFFVVHERAKKAQANAATLLGFGSFSWRNLSNDNRVGPVLISPDGKFIVYAQRESNSTGSVRMRLLNSDEAVTVMPPSNQGGWGMTLTHDGSFLYYTMADDVPDTGTLYKVSVLGGAPRKILEHINCAATLSPDDTRLAFMRFDTKHNLISLITANASDGADERVIESSDNGPTLVQPVWSPDGARIACFVRERKPDGNYWSLVEIPADGGPIKGITTPRRQQIWWFAWMPDGRGFAMDATDTVSGKVQIYYVSYPGGEISRITNDLNQYNSISVDGKGEALVTTQMDRESNLYVTRDLDARSSVRINTKGCCPDAVDWTPDGRIVFDAIDEGKRQIWIMNSDGSGQEKLSTGRHDDWQPAVSLDGRYLVFLSNRSGARELWRTDIDGRNPKQLTFGSDSLWLAGISADGHWVYFTQYQNGMRVLLRLPLDGGPSTQVTPAQQVTNVQTDLWTISPDGHLLAYSFFDETLRHWRVAIQPTDGSAPAKFFEFQPNDILRWMPDGKSLVYKDSEPHPDNGNATLWQQPINGGRPHPLIAWPDQINYAAAWSRDGHLVAVVRGQQVSNIVMLKQSAEGSN